MMNLVRRIQEQPDIDDFGWIPLEVLLLNTTATLRGFSTFRVLRGGVYDGRDRPGNYAFDDSARRSARTPVGVAVPANSIR